MFIYYIIFKNEFLCKSHCYSLALEHLPINALTVSILKYLNLKLKHNSKIIFMILFKNSLTLGVKNIHNKIICHFDLFLRKKKFIFQVVVRREGIPQEQ